MERGHEGGFQIHIQGDTTAISQLLKVSVHLVQSGTRTLIQTRSHTQGQRNVAKTPSRSFLCDMQAFLC